LAISKAAAMENQLKLIRPIVFCGPSGAGKGTLIDLLMKAYPNNQFGFSVSHTTRQPRPGEMDGVHYNFCTVEQMKKDIMLDKFIEHAEVHGKFYGTSIAAVESVQSAGKVCVLDIDVQGVKNVKKSVLDPYYVFISPPSLEQLEARLRGRGTESEEQIQTRTANASEEMAYGTTAANFDLVLVNDDLSKAFNSLVKVIQGWYPNLKAETSTTEALETLKVVESSFRDIELQMEENISYRPVVFCGPSGAGKGTLIDLIMNRFDNDLFGFSVSHTTRNPRDGEINGKHYHFTTVEQMRKGIASEKFIEHAEVHGKYYGTSFAAVESVQSSGKICVLDIDVQGVKNVKKSPLNAYYVFVSPPNMETLETRLRKRGTESEEQIRIRLGNAQAELAYGKESGNVDLFLVNDTLENALDKLSTALQGWYPHLKPTTTVTDAVIKSAPRVCKPSEVCAILQ
jgi:guanylate kinase